MKAPSSADNTLLRDHTESLSARTREHRRTTTPQDLLVYGLSIEDAAAYGAALSEVEDLDLATAAPGLLIRALAELAEALDSNRDPESGESISSPMLTHTARVSLTTRDAVGWLCATLVGSNDANVGDAHQATITVRAMVPYLAVDHGWVYHAAGIAPSETTHGDPVRARALAVAHGRHLPLVGGGA